MQRYRATFLMLALALSLATPGWSSPFVRGDANVDGTVDISDAVQLLLCTFGGSDCSSCADASDVNDDGALNIADPIALLGFLFSEGLEPPAPGGICGTDSTPDDLECLAYALCGGEDTIPTSRGLLEVFPVDHASFVLAWDGKTIHVDPVGGAGLYADFPAPDIVLITHTHGDHMHANTLEALVHENTVLVVPESVSEGLAGEDLLQVVDERVLANGESTDLGAIRVEAVPMYNLTEERLRYHAQGVGNGYVLDLDGTRVYIAGDTEDIPEMRALTDIDLAFICMNLPFTMTPEQAASAVLEFKPRVVYPYHSRGQDTAVFKAQVEAASETIDVRLRNWYP